MTTADSTTRLRTPRWRDGAIILGFVVLVALPLFRGVPGQEAARWQAARAVEIYLNGDTKGGTQALEQAVAQLPGDHSLQLRLANWFIQQGEMQRAGKLLDEMIQRLEPLTGNSASASSYWLQALTVRAGTLWAENRGQQALALTKQRQEMIVPRTPEETVFLVNELTYMRALTNLELEAGAADARQLLGLKLFELDRPRELFATLRTGGVIAAMLLESRLGKTEVVRSVLDREIEGLQTTYDELTADLLLRAYVPLAAGGLPLNDATVNELNPRWEQASRLGGELAALLTVRAFIDEQQGLLDAARIDRQRVAQLGWSSSQLIARLPDDRTLLGILEQAVSYLDTVGYFEHQLGEFEFAIRDLNIAIAGLEVLQSAMGTELQNLPELSFDIRQQRRDMKYLRAVLYQHRWRAYNSQGLTKPAAADARVIESLGFTVDQPLF